jgi:hypothetical protein
MKEIDPETKGLLDLLLCIQVAGRPLSTEEILQMQGPRLSINAIQRRLDMLMQGGQIHSRIDPGSGRKLWVSGPPPTAALVRGKDARRLAMAAARATKEREKIPEKKKNAARAAQVERPVSEFAPRREPLLAALFGPM